MGGHSESSQERMTLTRALPRRRQRRIGHRLRVDASGCTRALNRARASALAVLVAMTVGGCGNGINTARLPGRLDVNRLIGMRLPGTPTCAFENKARTFLRTGSNQVQGIDIQCAGATGQVVVFGADRTPPLVDGELRCSDLGRGGPGFGCGVSRDMLTAGTQRQCSGCDAEAAARRLMARLVELLSTLSERAPPRSISPCQPRLISTVCRACASPARRPAPSRPRCSVMPSPARARSICAALRRRVRS